ncbi:hypothetical protein GQ457_05G019190 [Hibiscus cannabinus]
MRDPTMGSPMASYEEKLFEDYTYVAPKEDGIIDEEELELLDGDVRRRPMIKLMDIENNYFLVTFCTHSDYESSFRRSLDYFREALLLKLESVLVILSGLIIKRKGIDGVSSREWPLACTLTNECVQPVGYESLHVICFSCGKYGRSLDSCVMTSLAPPKDSISSKDCIVAHYRMGNVALVLLPCMWDFAVAIRVDKDKSSCNRFMQSMIGGSLLSV